MIEFYFPELLLIAFPLAFVFWRYGRYGKATSVIRGFIAALLILAVAGPLYNLGGEGLDVIVVADRSRSMSPESQRSVVELLNNLERNRSHGDRVALITFGSTAQIERVPSANALFKEYSKPLNIDGSDLNAAVQSAVNISDDKRPTRILVLSDGEANGLDPSSAARLAREANVPIDYRLYDRLRVGDIAVESVNLPEKVSPREPFQFSVFVQADQIADGTLVIKRNGQVIATAERSFDLGRNRFLFRDIVDAPGFLNYEAELVLDGDPIIENNRGEGGLRVDAGPRLLVLNSDGQAGNLVQALRAGRIDVDVAKAQEFPLSQDTLDPYRAVILENVPARDFGRKKMELLAQYVEDLGGGMLITGGQRSFGVGGYFNSPLDDILPVSMEMREEHRKNRLALAIALDRSGSMMAPVSGGKTKMDLANLGTAECIRLLSPGDSVAVIAVDSSPHRIVPLKNVDNPEAIANQVLGIESMGGGIFVYEALVAAGDELVKAEQSTKHIILFSDAADSEEPGSYKSLLKSFEGAGITVSVIGLGQTSDPDAKLLEDIAKLGSGNIMFTNDAAELPRLFTEETMSVARSSFIEKDPATQPAGIGGQQLTDSRLIGDWGSSPFPNVDGYNLSYLKPDATMGVVSQDEYAAPFSAFWYRGVGRVAAITVEVDGQFSGGLSSWEEYPDFLITHARWLLGGESPEDVFVTVDRDGQDAVATIELDPNRPNRGGNEIPEMIVVPPGDERTETFTPEFTWVGPDTLQARFRMETMGTYRTLVKTSSREFQRGPALSLPYSPEFAPRPGLPSGKEVLAELATLTGGEQRTEVLSIFDNPPRSPKKVSLVPHLLIMTIVLIILEIAGRRLALWSDLFQRSAAATEEPEAAPKYRGPKSRPQPTAKKKTVPEKLASAKPTTKPTEPPPKDAKPKVDIFAQAKERARRRRD
ncbi:VWA domain-containing protein [uncultured Rubinisphaera sp.]|uniref:VWA domain-containing protein n=1 Tax=uncultured Rubinisphaera sp. TaxID=1678686 RepID=UPI0030DC067B